MSGTGKSTVIDALAARGYKAIDTDSIEWLRAPSTDPVGVTGDHDWVWREDRMNQLLSTEDVPVLFVSGCRENQGAFYAQFEYIILLSAPVPVLVERLATRTDNPYGKHPDDLARILQQVHTIEPLLRRRASLEVDTSITLDQVVRTILDHVQAPGRLLECH